ncbi:hypothetical protein B1R94_07780 [Mycolicibacterium litorale]|nr:hypothetical protein B1R94_07780 [Mycolicibacterium litorale]
MVRNQFKARAYAVDDIHMSVGNLETFTVESGPDSPNVVGVPVTFIPDSERSLSGDVWKASEIHWWTDKQEYSGTTESPAELADRIIETASADNDR